MATGRVLGLASSAMTRVIVSVDSLRLEGAPEPLIVNGAHGMILRRLFADDPTPLAIAAIIEQPQEWCGVASPADGP